jgi:hypothetical protein
MKKLFFISFLLACIGLHAQSYIGFKPLRDVTDSVNLINTQNKDLKLKVSTFTTQVSNLTTQVTTLTSQVNVLTNQVVAVTKSRDSLQKIVGTVPPVVVPPVVSKADYYVATNGNDANPGTFDKPFATWSKAYSVMNPGQLCYIRGGTYYVNVANTGGNGGVIFSGRNGTAGNLIKIWNYPGETPILRPDNGYANDWGILLNCNYIHLKGLEICYFVQDANAHLACGIYTFGTAYTCSNSIFENLNIHNNGIGCVVKGTGNYFLNSDFHHNVDPYRGYQNGDGLDIEALNPTQNNGLSVVEGCRAWNNADDGFDTWHNNDQVNFKNCWSWHNGVREDGITLGGDGNGFKLGATTSAFNTVIKKIVTNCISFQNTGHGFDKNVDTSIGEGSGIFNVFNCTSASNGWNRTTSWYVGYDFNYNTITPDVVRNCISFSDKNGQYLFNAQTTHDHNSWNTGFSVSSSDFQSLDYTQLALPRKADGSLPTITFLHLNANSKLINAGVNLNYGTNIGAF